MLPQEVAFRSSPSVLTQSDVGKIVLARGKQGLFSSR